MAAAATEWKTIGSFSVDPGRLLGRGTFGRVYYGVSLDDGREAAVKEVNTMRVMEEKSKEKFHKLLEREVEVMKLLDHPNIVKSYECVHIKRRLYFTMEYCGGGDLKAYIAAASDKRLSEDVALIIARHLVAALEYLCLNNLIHRDLKPANILLTGDPAAGGVAKLADFGFARTVETDDMACTLLGTPLYMAPEVMHSLPYNCKADLWSAGAIIYEMVEGQSPYFGSRDPMHLARRVQTEVPVITNPDVSDGYKALVRRMLTYNVDERADTTELLRNETLNMAAYEHEQAEVESEINDLLASGELVESASQIATPTTPRNTQAGTTDEDEFVIIDTDFVTVNEFADQHEEELELEEVSKLFSVRSDVSGDTFAAYTAITGEEVASTDEAAVLRVLHSIGQCVVATNTVAETFFQQNDLVRACVCYAHCVELFRVAFRTVIDGDVSSRNIHTAVAGLRYWFNRISENHGVADRSLAESQQTGSSSTTTNNDSDLECRVQPLLLDRARELIATGRRNAITGSRKTAVENFRTAGVLAESAMQTEGLSADDRSAAGAIKVDSLGAVDSVYL